VSRAWRLIKTRHRADAWSGEGARWYGGRWNRKGDDAVYASSSSALAALEVLVHLERADVLRASYTLFAIEIDDALVESLNPADLPGDWNRFPAPPSTAGIGHRFLSAGASLALRVPSVIVPGESNFLLNPNHAAFGDLVATATEERFAFDPRLG
jgi:RES domain-containing protein